MDDLLKNFKLILEKDWNEKKWFIGVTEDDLVEIHFVESTVDHVGYLTAYMNRLPDDERIS